MPSPRNSMLRTAYLTLALVWFGLLGYVALEQLSGMLTYRDFSIDPWLRLRTFTTYYWMPWLALVLPILALSARMPIRPGSVLKPVAAHAALFLLLALVHGLATSYNYAFSDSISEFMATFYPWQHSGHFLFGDYMLVFDLVFYSLLAAATNMDGFLSELRRRETQASRLAEQLTNLRLQALRMQLNPHFLFNALNSVAALVAMRQNDNARKAIGSISRYLRMTLDDSMSQQITLAEELQLAREYLEIVRLRFGDRLQVDIDCAEPYEETVVPALILQPLVENAVRHGFADKEDQCRLEIVCIQADEQLEIRIADNGSGLPQNASNAMRNNGLGVANVRNRLQDFYGKAASLKFEPKRLQGTTVSVRVPFTPHPVRLAAAR